MLRVVQVVHQQQCNGHCLCDSVQARKLKQQLRSAQVAGQWRGDTALTLPLFWRPSTVSPVFFRRFPRSRLHSVVPFPLCPPVPNKPSHFRGRKATVKQAKQVSYCTCKPKTFYTEDTRIQGYLLASDIKMYTGIYLGDVPLIQSINFKQLNSTKKAQSTPDLDGGRGELPPFSRNCRGG